MAFDDCAALLGIEPRMLYTVAQVSKVLGVSERTVKAEMDSGRMRFKNVGNRTRGSLSRMTRGVWVDEWTEVSNG